MIKLLPVKLTDEELNAKRDEIAKCASELNSTEQAKSEASANFGGQIKKIRQTMTTLADHITAKREYRDVACEERPDYDNNVVEIWRKDTDELVATRIMQPEERQNKMKLVSMQKKEAVAEGGD